MKNLLALLLLSLLYSCKETDTRPKCRSVVHAPQEYLDYWFFPKGSWWVYKLKGSQPAEYDTVRNGNRHRAFYAEPYEDPGLADHCEMFYVHDLTHSNQTYFMGHNPASGYIGAEGLRGWRMGRKWVIDQSWDASGHAAENIFFFYPFTIGEVHMVHNNWVSDTNAVVTPNYTFPNSVTFMRGYYTPDSSDYVVRKVSFSQGVGISYRRYYNGQEWELVNYHINR